MTRIVAGLLLPLAVCAAQTRTTLVVRSDDRTGRLVRSLAVEPGVAGEEEGTAVEQPAVARTVLEEMINTIAEKHDVEPLLVHSVIKAESNYNPFAVSPKGAQGLMQLIPATARRFGVANSFNPQQNIEGGVKYLRFLMDLFNRDYVKVIAAYNAGEAAVTKYNGIPPFPETRGYVYAVGRNLLAARKAAEANAQAKQPDAKPETADEIAPGGEEKFHPIQAVTGPDGRVYYKTQ